MNFAPLFVKDVIGLDKIFFELPLGSCSFFWVFLELVESGGAAWPDVVKSIGLYALFLVAIEGIGQRTRLLHNYLSYFLLSKELELAGCVLFWLKLSQGILLPHFQVHTCRQQFSINYSYQANNHLFKYIFPENMIAIELLGLLGCAFSSMLTFRAARHCKLENEDIFMPFTSILFTFYPLIVSLPEAHYKLMKYTIHNEFNDQSIDEDELFPQAFLVSTITVTACICISKYFFDAASGQKKQGEQQKEELIVQNTNGLKFFLPFGLFLQNIVNFYYICIEQKQSQMIKELVLLLCYGSLLSFSFVYILFENQVKPETIRKLLIFITCGYLAGFLLSLVVSPFQGFLVLPSISIGFQIYVSVFLLLGKIFSGENTSKDKSNYCTVIIAFLITIIYYPFCFILRI